MNNIVQLMTTTDGRISRKSWWLGVVILIVAGIVLSLILGMVGFGIWPNMAAFESGDPQTISQALAASSRAAAWGGVISFVILAYPGYALSMKRRHDRDNNGLDLQIYYGLTFVLLLLQALGIGYTQMPVPGVEGVTIPQPGMITMILGLVTGIFALYLLVVLGFLRGTPGPNQYGADPVGGTATATA
jgi:uncharacterized membrane protein YhaH (DUF805 family)